MPFVFKISTFLILAALVGGQAWQHRDAAPGSDAFADRYRVSCPAMDGPEVIVTKGDKVRFYDAYALRVLGGLVGINSGCAAE